MKVSDNQRVDKTRKAACMTPDAFVYWLRGIFEFHAPQSLDAAQTKMIRDHLDLVFAERPGSAEAPEEHISEDPSPESTDAAELFESLPDTPEADERILAAIERLKTAQSRRTPTQRTSHLGCPHGRRYC